MHVDPARIFINQSSKVVKVHRIYKLRSRLVCFKRVSRSYAFFGPGNHIGLLNIRKLDSRGSIHEMKLESV